jgi:hypothetical protein
MGQVLPAMQAQAGTPPASVAGVEVVGSLDGLVAAVEQDASFWCGQPAGAQQCDGCSGVGRRLGAAGVLAGGRCDGCGVHTLVS